MALAASEGAEEGVSLSRSLFTSRAVSVGAFLAYLLTLSIQTGLLSK